MNADHLGQRLPEEIEPMPNDPLVFVELRAAGINYALQPFVD